MVGVGGGQPIRMQLAIHHKYTDQCAAMAKGLAVIFDNPSVHIPAAVFSLILSHSWS